MYLGFDIGGTNVKYGIVNEHGIIIDKSIMPTNREKALLMQDLLAVTRKFQSEYTIDGIGVSVPGIVQNNEYLLTGGAIKELYGVHLKDEIEEATGLPVMIENDGNSVAIAEKWVGNAVDIKNYLCIVLGTGVGGGIVINNELYRGAHGMAGEFGYMIMNEFAENQDIELFSLNQNGAVVGGLYRNYDLALLENGLQPISGVDANEIMKLANSGDPIAKKVLETFYRVIATGIINLISSFDPQVVLVGGGISANETFMTNLNQTIDYIKMRHDSIRYLNNKTIAKVKPAKLKNDAGIIGAAYLIKEKLKQNERMT